MLSSLSWYVRNLPYLVATMGRMRGVFDRTCNICLYEGRFGAFGSPPRFDAQCPGCGSLERHRHLFLWLYENEANLARYSVLHFAAEGILASYLRMKARSYRSADLRPGAGDVVLNIEAIDAPDASVDMVVCNHVLEHVDYKRALAEIHRILASPGIAIFTFPYVAGWDATYENPAVTSEKQRVLHFGQNDHVRFFGTDVRERIREAGFEIEELTATEPEVHRHGLIRGDKIFVSRKR